MAELTRLLLAALRAAGGTVVFVNSGSGLDARAPLATYAASKFALRAYENDYLRPETVAGVLASVLALPAVGLICDLILRPSGRGWTLPGQFLYFG